MKFNVVFIFVTISAFLQIHLVTSDYVMPVPGDCTKYQICDYSGCFVFNCGIGTEFNPRILVCDYPLRDRGACGIRDTNIGPTIPYPGRAVPSTPSYQEPTNYNPGIPSNPRYSNPGIPSSPGPNTGYPNPGLPSSPGPNTGSPNPGFPSSPGPNTGYPNSGGSNPAPSFPDCPAYCQRI